MSWILLSYLIVVPGVVISVSIYAFTAYTEPTCCSHIQRISCLENLEESLGYHVWVFQDSLYN